MKLPKLEDYLNSIKKAPTGTENDDEKEQNKQKDELERQLDEFEKAYKNSPYYTYGKYQIANMSEKDYTPKTDEEIEKIASDEVGKGVEDKKNKIISDGEKAKRQLEKESESVLKNTEDAIQKLADDSDKASQNVQNQALKRGLGRSSIIMEELADIDKAKIDGSASVYANANQKLADIDEELSSLSQAVENSLSSLDKETAEKLTTAIAKLKEARDKEKNEVDEYNNEVRRKIADSRNNLAKNGVASGERDSEEYSSMIGQKIKALYNYYYSLGDDMASELEKDKEFIKSHVGDGGYNVLKDRLMA